MRRKTPDRFLKRHDLGSCCHGNAQQWPMPCIDSRAFHRLMPLGSAGMGWLETTCSSLSRQCLCNKTCVGNGDTPWSPAVRLYWWIDHSDRKDVLVEVDWPHPVFDIARLQVHSTYISSSNDEDKSLELMSRQFVKHNSTRPAQPICPVRPWPFLDSTIHFSFKKCARKMLIEIVKPEIIGL